MGQTARLQMGRHQALDTVLVVRGRKPGAAGSLPILCAHHVSARGTSSPANSPMPRWKATYATPWGNV